MTEGPAYGEPIITDQKYIDFEIIYRITYKV